MSDSRDNAIWFSRSHRLDPGPRVHLRLARPSDPPLLRELLRRVGVSAEESELRRLVRFDPRHRAVACATALIDGSERILAVGAIDFAGQLSEPDLLIGDPEHSPPAVELMEQGLRGRAARRRRAARRGRAALVRT